MHQKKIICFDFDGTLVDSSVFVCCAFDVIFCRNRVAIFGSNDSGIGTGIQSIIHIVNTTLL